MKRRDFLHAAAWTPVLLAAAPQGDDLGRKFEGLRATDPVAAFKLLSDTPGDVAQKAGRPALAKQITQDAAAGLKAFADGKFDAAEPALSRAALLADLYSPDFSKQLIRMVFLSKQARKTTTGCASCKGAGASACKDCQSGQVLGTCPLCEAKGTLPCLICDGSGTLDHRGYKGTLVLTLDHEVVVPWKDAKGKTVRARVAAQTLTYQMSPCAGGSFNLQTESVPLKGEKKNETRNQPCHTFWGEMKMFVFSGKAKIKVNNNKGQLSPLSSQGARRFLADYEICTAGRVACDRCLGKKTEPCAACHGNGKTQLPCPKCEGSMLIACASCKGYGDATWMAKVVAPASAPALCKLLADEAGELKTWIDDRSRRALRQQELTRRLEEAKKGNDPSAKLTADFVDVVCAKCKGAGGECEDCWGTGRREFYEGTSVYERYAVVERLSRQLADLAKLPTAPPVLAPLPESEGGAPVVQNPVKPAPPSLPAGPSPAGVAIPASIEEMIKQADAFHETGKSHLEKSKAASDNATWIDEGMKALADFKKAQILYTAAQEKLDETGGTVPRSLIEKFRTNMQGLVMARKQVP